MSCNYLIKNALVVNEGEICQKDILIANGLIEDIAGCIDLTRDYRQLHGIETLDISGKYVMPWRHRRPGAFQGAWTYPQRRPLLRIESGSCRWDNLLYGDAQHPSANYNKHSS